MNLREFTEAVDGKAKELSRQELAGFVHSIARKVPPESREAFMETMESVRDALRASKENPSVGSGMRKVEEAEIQRELGRLKELLGRVSEEELTLYADGYEEYPEDYWGEGDWVWEYRDEEGICQAYEDGCSLTLRCVNDGFYKEAVEIFDLLMGTEVTVENEWDYFSMGLERMAEEELIGSDLKNLALHVLYAAYQASGPKDRAQALYGYFSVSCFKEIELEDVLSLGKEELQGLPEFWDSWIELLSEKEGDLEGRLLKEAVLYHRGWQGMLDAARLAYERHPLLYLEVLEDLERAGESVRQLEVGKEALQRIDKKYVCRSRIALKAADAAVCLERDEDAEKCWLEAFFSQTTPLNYLRIVNESREPERYLEAVSAVILSVSDDSRGGNGSYAKNDRYSGGYHGRRTPCAELKKNEVPEEFVNILGFLNGDFDVAMEKCCKVREPLGWSGKFVKCGLALFLLLLVKEEGWREGCGEMAKKLLHYTDFHADEYFKGTKHQLENRENGPAVFTSEEVFRRCFNFWKKGYVLTPGQEHGYVRKIEKLIDQRVRAIISGQHRAHYGSVAALAAALGEVKESLGEVNGKEHILQKYRMEFPRHSAFHEELRRYGMPDTRKGRRRS